MITRPSIHEIAWLLLTVAVGVTLGYVQDPVTQYLNSFLNMPLVLLGLGWCWISSVTAYGVALKIPWFRPLGGKPTCRGLTTLLLFWLAAVSGGVGYFLRNGMDYQTLWGAIGLSAFIAAGYNFGLVLLPLWIIRTLQPRRHIRL